MIESIEVSGVANYAPGPHRLEALKAVNFIFGNNGSGKTTISQLLAKPAAPTSACTVRWRGGSPHRVLVYNAAFVNQVIRDTDGMPGVFTVGEEDADLQQSIENTKDEIAELDRRIAQIRALIDPEAGEAAMLRRLSDLEQAFVEDCWKYKLVHDSHFREVFSRCKIRGRKADFADFSRKEAHSNKAQAKPLVTLQSEVRAAFDSSKSEVGVPAALDLTKLNELAANPLLGEAVVGTSEVDLGGLIDALGNSDWVRAGVQFLERDPRKCPFCQQSAPSDLRDRLSRYFDEAYDKKLAGIGTLCDAYRLAAQNAITVARGWAALPPDIVDAGTVADLTARLDQILLENIRRIESKKAEPSRVVALEPLQQVETELAAIYTALSADVMRHNQMVANRSAVQTRLVAEVWQHLLQSGLKQAVENYEKKYNGATAALDNKHKELATAKSKRSEKQTALQGLERQTTSVQPTVDSINKTLTSFGFNSFKLQLSPDNKAYQLVRKDGTVANHTLSEGERTFIAFLYFYHLLDGNTSGASVSDPRVIVLDDPVSSLDSEVLFIVSALTRRLLNRVWDPTSNFVQAFVLSHNVYYFKEVTFEQQRARRSGTPSRSRSFWVLRKADDGTHIERYPENPISTTYELLWAEVKDGNSTGIALQNAMRRILENYFRVLGGVDPHDMIDQLDPKDQPVCQSLFAWVNDGSHSALGDEFLVADSGTADRYRAVFERIFREMDHGSHYDMMMGQVAT